MGRTHTKFTIIVPTIGRDTLEKTLESIDALDYPNYDCITAFDLGYNNFGNTQRYNAWDDVDDDSWILYLDDDDYYIRADLLTKLDERIQATDGKYVWGVFSGNRYGEKFLNMPPGHSRTMSIQIFHKKYDNNDNPIRWPDTPIGSQDYHVDAKFIQRLQMHYPYLVVDGDPFVEAPYMSKGEK